MNVLVVCASGMSSSALKERMKKEIANRNLDIKVGACGTSQFLTYAKKADIVLIAPQISYLQEEIKKHTSSVCLIISEEIYGNSDGNALVEMVLHPENYIAKKEEKKGIQSFISKFSSNETVLAIMDGFRMIFPVSMIGSVFSLLSTLPIPYLDSVISSSVLGNFLDIGYDMTIGMVSLYLCFSIAMYLAIRKGVKKEALVLATVIDFIALSGISEKGWLNIKYCDGSGMLTAILCSVATYKIYVFTEHFIEKRKKEIISSNIIESLNSMIPISVCLLCTCVFSCLFYLKFRMFFTEWQTKILSEKIGEMVGNSMFTLVLLNIIASLLWFFGLHGGKIIGIVRDPIYKPLSLANLNAWKNHLPLPYVCIGQSSYIYMFGGGGSTLCLAFLMAFFAKSNKLKKLGKIAFPMGIFFINEPIIFGLPYVLNFSLLIPFLLVPTVSGFLTMSLTYIGVLPRIIGLEIPWTTPPVVTGMIQGGWKLALWQVILLVLQTLMWYPFFKKLDAEAIDCEEETCSQSNALQ